MKKSETATSTIRQDTRAQASRVGIASGLVNPQTGVLLETCVATDSDCAEEVERTLADMGSAVSEILATDRIAWDVIFEKVGEARHGDGLDNILLISPERFYSAQRCPSPARQTHLCMAKRNRNVGFFMSEARALFEKLDTGEES